MVSDKDPVAKRAGANVTGVGIIYLWYYVLMLTWLAEWQDIRETSTPSCCRL